MIGMPLSATDMCIYQKPEIGGNTEIITAEGESRFVDKRAEQLIDETLIYFGSNIKTRRQSARVLIQHTHHLPIIIEPTLQWMYYPVHQSKAHFQLFLQHQMIYHFEGNKHTTIIHFINNTQLEVPQNIAFIQKQHQKALLLADMQSKIIKRQLHLSSYRESF